MLIHLFSSTFIFLFISICLFSGVLTNKIFAIFFMLFISFFICLSGGRENALTYLKTKKLCSLPLYLYFSRPC